MIALKILNVMTKIGPIIKDKTNEEKGFDYASIASIIIKAREAMIEEKVIIIPLKLNQVVQKGNDVIIDMVYDAEKDKYTSDINEENDVTIDGSLNEDNIEKILGDPDIDDFDNLFSLGKMTG